MKYGRMRMFHHALGDPAIEVREHEKARYEKLGIDEETINRFKAAVLR